VAGVVRGIVMVVLVHLPPLGPERPRPTGVADLGADLASLIEEIIDHPTIF